MFQSIDTNARHRLHYVSSRQATSCAGTASRRWAAPGEATKAEGAPDATPPLVFAYERERVPATA